MYTRLYYDRGAGAASGQQTAPGLQDAAEKVAKLVPVELVTAYGALVSAATAIANVGLRPWAFGIVFVLCWVLTPLYLKKVAEDGPPSRNFILVSTVAFPFWAYLVSGNQVIPQFYDPAIATIAATLFSLGAGLIPMNR